MLFWLETIRLDQNVNYFPQQNQRKSLILHSRFNIAADVIIYMVLLISFRTHRENELPKSERLSQEDEHFSFVAN